MYVSHWLRKLASTPRHSLFSPRGSVLESVEEEMKAWSTRMGVTNVETDLKEEVKVFGDNEGEVSVFVAKSPLFDVYTFGAVCVYLTGMYGMVMMMHGVGEKWKGVMDRERRM